MDLKNFYACALIYIISTQRPDLKTGMDFRGLVWKRVWKISFLGVWNRVKIWRTGWHSPTKKSQEYPTPGTGPSITHLFSFWIAFTIWTNQEPVFRKAWKGSKANFETKTGSLIKNLRYNLKFKTSSCFLKFCTLGQKDSKIHVVSVLAFLLIAVAHSHFYTNTSLICRFYMLGNKLNTTKYHAFISQKIRTYLKFRLISIYIRTCLG